MRTVSGKELCELLERHGWQLLRIHGSHHVYGKTGNRARPSVPVHGNKPLKKGLVHHLLKIAGLQAELE